MKRKILSLIVKTGLFRLASFVNRNNVSILYFHRFYNDTSANKTGHSVEFLDQCLSLLNRYFFLASMNDVIDGIHSGRMPQNAVVLTVDDGYRDFYDVAWPVFKAHKAPVTLFVTVDFIEKKCWLWPDKITYLITNTEQEYLNIAYGGERSQVYQLGSGSGRNDAIVDMMSYCKTLPEEDKNIAIQELEENCCVVLPSIPPEQFSALTWGQLREMAAEGLDIGAHTMSHPIMTRLTEEQAHYEIRMSKKIIDEKINRNINTFCYPNGRKSDYDETIKKIVMKNGFLAAVATNEGSVNKYADLMELNRYSAPYNLLSMIKKVSGL